MGNRSGVSRSLAAILASLAIVVAGCGQEPLAAIPAPAESSTTSATAAAPPPPALAPPAPDDDLIGSFSALAETIEGSVGVAVSNGAQTWTFGVETTGPAWSTIKVPLAIAAQRSLGDTVQALATRAIEQSDNAAAEELWAMLDGGAAAAAAVETVLRETGDPTTKVQSDRVRPSFTPFGQTDWSNEMQAKFAARLPCVAGAAPVVELMRNVSGGQQWGIADQADAAVKGGWGPDVDGMYSVRQIALLGDAAGAVGVALIARPGDGSFDSGVAVVSQLAEWVASNRARFAPMPC